MRIMTAIFIIISAFITGSFTFLLFIYKKVIKKINESKNHVHFYVARNANYRLILFLGKPLKRVDCGYYKSCGHSVSIATQEYFESFGLNINDFKYLSWEDEPVEVFINIED